MCRVGIDQIAAWVVALACLALAAPVASQAAVDPAAKQLTRCHDEILERGGAFLAADLKTLEACAAAVFKCIQTKPGNGRCLASVAKSCARGLDKGRATNAKRFAARVVGRCAAVPLADLLGSTGLGYAALAGTCATDFGIEITDGATLAGCLQRNVQRSAETLFGAERPRARELIVREAGVDPALVPFLPELGATRDGEESANLEKVPAKRLVDCSAAMAKAGKEFAGDTLADTQDCLTDLFSCTRLKPGDAVCFLDAVDKCRTIGRAGARRDALAASVRKICAPPNPNANPRKQPVAFDTLRSLPGVNLNGLGCECGSLGFARVTSLDDAITCLARQHACRARALVRVLEPNVDATFTNLGIDMTSFADCPEAAGSTALAGGPRAGARVRFGDLFKSIRAGNSQGRVRGGSPPSASRRRAIANVFGGRLVKSGGKNGLRVQYMRGVARARDGGALGEARGEPPPTLVVRADVFQGIPVDDFMTVELPPDPPPNQITADCTLDTCEVDVTLEFADELGACAFQPAFALAENAAATQASAYVPFEQTPDSPAAPRRVLVMPFDATGGRVSTQSVSRAGDGLEGDPLATHWAYFAADGRLLADVFVCLVPDDTAVLDVSRVQGQRQTTSPLANVGIGPVTNLTGERGIVVVSAYRGDARTSCTIVDPNEILDPDAATDLLIGTWRIGDPATGTDVVGKPLGFLEGRLIDSSDFPVFADARLIVQTADPDALASAEVVVVGLEASEESGALPGLELGPIPRGSDDLDGAHACCDVSVVDANGIGTTLLPFCFDAAGFAPLTDALARPGETALVPADLLPGTPGFVRIGACTVADLDGSAIFVGDSFIHAVYAFAGQNVGRGREAASTAKIESQENPIVGDPPSAGLVMPFDATTNKTSLSIVSHAANIPTGERIATHWVYWAADGRFLAETIACLDDDATLVVDPTSLPGAATPRADLGGERGFVTVHAYPAVQEGACAISDAQFTVSRALVGTWFIGDTTTQTGFGNDAAGFEEGIPTSLDGLETAFFTTGGGATVPTFAPGALADSEVILIGLETGPDGRGEEFALNEPVPIPRTAAALGGASICCRARLTDDRGVAIVLPDVCLGGAAFMPLTAALADAGETALVPSTVPVTSPGLVKLFGCVTPDETGAIIEFGATDRATQVLLVFHGQSPS